MNITMKATIMMIANENEQIIPSVHLPSGSSPSSLRIFGVTASSIRRSDGGISSATPRVNRRRWFGSGSSMRIGRGGRVGVVHPREANDRARLGQHRGAGLVLVHQAQHESVRGGHRLVGRATIMPWANSGGTVIGRVTGRFASVSAAMTRPPSPARATVGALTYAAASPGRAPSYCVAGSADRTLPGDERQNSTRSPSAVPRRWDGRGEDRCRAGRTAGPGGVVADSVPVGP